MKRFFSTLMILVVACFARAAQAGEQPSYAKSSADYIRVQACAPILPSGESATNCSDAQGAKVLWVHFFGSVANTYIVFKTYPTAKEVTAYPFHEFNAKGSVWGAAIPLPVFTQTQASKATKLVRENLSNGCPFALKIDHQDGTILDLKQLDSECRK